MSGYSVAARLARIAWAVPIAILLLAVQQAVVSVDLRKTVRDGSMVRAAVLRYDRTDRKDVTHAEMDLSVPLSEGDSLYVEHLALPYTIAHRVEETDSLDVYVLPGSRQQVVIASIEGTQRRIAFYNALMSLIGFVIAAVGVFYWNRSTGGAKDSPLTEGNMGASKMRVRPREDAE